MRRYVWFKINVSVRVYKIVEKKEMMDVVFNYLLLKVGSVEISKLNFVFWYVKFVVCKIKFGLLLFVFLIEE